MAYNREHAMQDMTLPEARTALINALPDGGTIHLRSHLRYDPEGERDELVYHLDVCAPEHDGIPSVIFHTTQPRTDLRGLVERAQITCYEFSEKMEAELEKAATNGTH